MVGHDVFEPKIVVEPVGQAYFAIVMRQVSIHTELPPPA